MGLFKNVRELNAQAKQAQRQFDPAAQMREARQQMQLLTAQTELTSSTTALRSPATVVEVRDTGTLVNHQPMIECDVTVQPVGGTPFAATLTLLGVAHLASIRTGGTVTVIHEPGRTEPVALG